MKTSPRLASVALLGIAAVALIASSASAGTKRVRYNPNEIDAVMQDFWKEFGGLAMQLFTGEMVAVNSGNLTTSTDALNAAAGDYRSKVTGIYGTASNWETFDGTNWVTASSVPAASSAGAINILNSHTMTVGAAVAIDQFIIDAGGQLTVNSSIALTLANGTGVDLTINGTMLQQGSWTINTSASMTVANGGTYIHNTASSLATALNAMTLATGSTVIIRGSSTVNAPVAIANRTYHNLSLESSSGTWTPTSPSGSTPWVVNGDLSIGSGVNLSLASFTGTQTFAGNVTIGGTMSSSNSFTINSTKQLLINSGGNLGMASGFTATIATGAKAQILGSGVLSGSGNFTLSSGATFITSNTTGLNGAVTASGTRSFSTGANYEFQGAGTGSALPSTVNNLTINRSAGNVTLDGTSATQTVSGTLSILSGNLQNGVTTNTVNAAELAMRNGQINSGVTTNVSGNVTFDATANGTATIAGNLGLGGATRTFSIGDGTAATDMSISGVVSNGGMLKTGNGTLELSNGSNSYSGGTTVSAGTLQLVGSGTLGSTSAELQVNGGTVNLNGTNQTVGKLTGSGGNISNNHATVESILTVGQGNATGGSYSGVIGGGSGRVISLVKKGTGTQTLTGTNNYTGTTQVTGGTLLVNGDQLGATGAVSATGAGSVLGGTGTIGGSVMLTDSGVLQGGSGAASGALTLAANVNTSAGIIQLALSGAGAHSSLAQTGGGTWTFGSSQVFNFLNLGVSFSGTPITFSGIITGLSAGAIDTNGWRITGNPGWDGFFTYNNGLSTEGSGLGSIDFTLTAVPEPSTYAAGILAVVAVAWTQRKRLNALRKRVA